MAETEDRERSKVPEFLREPLEAAQARLGQFEEEAQRGPEGPHGQGTCEPEGHRARSSHRLSKQDFSLPEVKQRLEKLRDQGVERAAEWRGKAETFRAEALERMVELQARGGRLPGRRDARAGGGAVARARAAREAAREDAPASEEGRSVRRRCSRTCRTCRRCSRTRGRSALAGVNAAEQEAEKVLAQDRRRRRVLARRRAAPRARVRRAAHRPAPRARADDRRRGEAGGEPVPHPDPDEHRGAAARVGRGPGPRRRDLAKEKQAAMMDGPSDWPRIGLAAASPLSGRRARARRASAAASRQRRPSRPPPPSEPGPPGLGRAASHERLVRRMPALADRDRRALARTIVAEARARPHRPAPRARAHRGRVRLRPGRPLVARGARA